MNIVKEIKKFDAEKNLKEIRKNIKSQYNIRESIYNFILLNINKDFYLSQAFKEFYLKQLEENFGDIQNLHYEFILECESIQEMYCEIITKHYDKLKNEEILKMTNFCVKALSIYMESMSKLTELMKINTDTIIFMNKYLVDINFRSFCREEIQTIPLYAKSINELYNIVKEREMKVISELQPVFNRGKICSKKENAFILVTEKELSALKSYNFILKEPVNFPIWEIEHFNDMAFKDGKGEGIFTEFTPLA